MPGAWAIFVQKGWKIIASARLLGRDEAGYGQWVTPLAPTTAPVSKSLSS